MREREKTLPKYCSRDMASQLDRLALDRQQTAIDANCTVAVGKQRLTR